MTIILSIIVFVLVASVTLAHMRTKSHVEIQEELDNMTMYIPQDEIQAHWRSEGYLD